MTLPVITFMLSLAGFLIVPVGVLAAKGEIVLLGLVGAVFLVQATSTGDWRSAFRTPVAAIFLALLAWALATAAWAISTPAALELWKSLALIFAAILIALKAVGSLSDHDRNRVTTWTAAGLALGLMILAIELAFGLPLTRTLQSGEAAPRFSTLNAGISVTIAVVWPLAAALWRRGQQGLGAGFIVAVAAVVVFSDGTSAKIAFAVAATVFAAVWLLQRRMVDILCLSAALMILAAPVAIQTIVPAPQSYDQSVSGPARSALHRLYIWDFAARRILDKPYTGWGLDSARDMPGGRRTVLDGAPVMSLHPHNAALQLWLELGAPGAALGALLVMVAGAQVRRLSRGGRATSAAALFAALSVAGLSFGVWQNWWMAALGLIAVLAAALNPAPDTDD